MDRTKESFAEPKLMFAEKGALLAPVISHGLDGIAPKGGLQFGGSPELTTHTRGTLPNFVVAYLLAN